MLQNIFKVSNGILFMITMCPRKNLAKNKFTGKHTITNNKIALLAIAVIIAASFATGIYFYPKMPDRMAFHWNTSGNVDGYADKFLGLFLMPLVSLGLALLFIVIPKIDPKRNNIAKFRKYYDAFVVMIIGFLFYLQLISIAWSIGMRSSVVYALIPAFALLFYFAGVLIQNSEKNFSIGIRTPWTLSSDKVWNKTHKLGGKLFKLAAIISLAGIVIEQYAFLLLIVPIIAVTIFTVVYSYAEYRKLKKW